VAAIIRDHVLGSIKYLPQQSPGGNGWAPAACRRASFRVSVLRPTPAGRRPSHADARGPDHHDPAHGTCGIRSLVLPVTSALFSVILMRY
jgi:hypothetical protein